MDVGGDVFAPEVTSKTVFVGEKEEYEENKTHVLSGDSGAPWHYEQQRP